jgi:hypothetical protein
MKIQNVDLLQKAVERADELQRQNEHYRRQCERADAAAARNLIPPVNSENPDAEFTMVRDDPALVNHEANAERKRLARQIAAGKPGAQEALDSFEKSRTATRPMTLVELLGELQKTRREVALATQAGDEQRLEAGKRKLRALHRERSRRGGIRVPA